VQASPPVAALAAVEEFLDLLEATGLYVVPGSGFGQLPGTHHFRTTILPETAQIHEFVEKLGAFQASYR
jgi:alanine transaminase